MSFTPNKNYNNQATGSNVNTWGIVLNSNFSTIDSNFGGTLSLSVAGNSNVTLTVNQAQNLIYNFSGALTGNINVIFPAAGGLYFINNQTTGNYTLTVQAGTSTSGILIPQGQQVPIYVDNSTSPPTVGGASGTQYVYQCGTVGGTANALTVSQTFPSDFTLSVGALITFTPTSINTGSATIAINGGSAIPLKKFSPTGLANLQGGDLFTSSPYIAQYNGSAWVVLNILYYPGPTTEGSNFNLGVANFLQPIVATAAVTATLAQTTTLPYFFNCFLNALGGSITLTPNGADAINVNGETLSAGSSFIMPEGSSGKLYTDANGNWYLDFIGPRLNAEASIASASTTDLGSAGSNIVAITGTTTITSFGSSAFTQSPLYFLRFTGALTLTDNATSLILPGGANIITAAGDAAIAKYEGGGNWRVINYAPASGKAVVTPAVSLPSFVNSLGSDVAMTSNSAFFDGPSTSQGTSGKFLATGTITVIDTSASGLFFVRLWDGTTIIDSTQGTPGGSNESISISVSGIITNPAGNLKISAKNTSSTHGKILWNQTGDQKDSTLNVVQIG